MDPLGCVTRFLALLVVEGSVRVWLWRARYREQRQKFPPVGNLKDNWLT